MSKLLVSRPGAAVDEARLVARAKSEPAAFAELYDRYLDRIYRYCYRVLGSRHAAEDATSRIFCRALAALPACRESSFRAWLFAIAHNVIVDSATREPAGRPLDWVEERPTRDPSPEEAVLAAEEHRSLSAALAQLTPEQRSVVELRLAGLTGAEIARALSRSPAAVKMLQLRAMKNLRALLGVEFGPGASSPHKEQGGL